MPTPYVQTNTNCSGKYTGFNVSFSIIDNLLIVLYEISLDNRHKLNCCWDYVFIKKV
jgi:hypothetical protein